MNQDGDCKGRLSPTGRQKPSLAVDFHISHEVAVRQSPSGEPVEWNKTTMHSVVSEDGAIIPQGDFDLVVGSELLRLKHLDGGSQMWLVLSGSA